MDFWRFAAVFLACTLVAIATKQYVAVFTCGLILFFFWQYLVLLRLLRWLRKEQGVPAPTQAGIVYDIVREVTRTRAQYQQQKAKLSAYLKQYQHAIAAVPDTVILLGQHDTIDWVNKPVDTYLDIKWPADEGLPLTNLVRSPRLKQYLACEDMAVLKAGLQLCSPNRPELHLVCYMVRYRKQQRLLIIHDVTVVHQTYQMRKNFVANASHELRTPLTVISGYLEMFVDSAEKCPPAWLPRVEQMRVQTKRMQQLIADLLLLSQLESSATDKSDTVAKVPDILADIQQELCPLGAACRHILQTKIAPSLWVKGSQRDLYSAFSNLISNAIQHTPAGTSIHIRWYQDEAGAHFEIVDNGPGVAPEHLSRLTERFYRIGPSSSTGLGLSIVKHALTRNAATLHIIHTPGAGACFRCDFPLSSIVNAD